MTEQIYQGRKHPTNCYKESEPMKKENIQKISNALKIMNEMIHTGKKYTPETKKMFNEALASLPVFVPENKE